MLQTWRSAYQRLTMTTAEEFALLCLTQCFPNLADHKSLAKNATKLFMTVLPAFYGACLQERSSGWLGFACP